MRGLLLVFTLVGALGVAFAYPYVGVMTWVWFSVMVPQESVYSFQGIQFNLIISAAALLSWLVSREPKAIPVGRTAILFYLLFLWMTFNQFFESIDPSYSYEFWDRVWKIYLMGVIVGILTTTKVRFHALMWIIILSLGYWGVKGGIFTIATGGGAHALGPTGSQIADNNEFALAVVTIIPPLNYVRLNTASRQIRAGLLVAIMLCIACVVGSQSRGGVIALGVLAVTFWFRAKRKLLYPIVAGLVIVALLNFMPESFWDRMHSIDAYQTDSSFQGRVDAWIVAWKYATQHFPFGAGFYALQIAKVYLQYSPDTIPHAAHSIYFQVLGEHGFVGLALYIMLIISTLADYRGIIVRTRNSVELRWANDLARMLQLSLVAFCVGGAALSVAYYDMFVLLVWMGVALKKYIAQELKTSASLSADSVREPIMGPAAAPLAANGGVQHLR